MTADKLTRDLAHAAPSSPLQVDRVEGAGRVGGEARDEASAMLAASVQERVEAVPNFGGPELLFTLPAVVIAIAVIAGVVLLVRRRRWR